MQSNNWCNNVFLQYINNLCDATESFISIRRPNSHICATQPHSRPHGCGDQEGHGPFTRLEAVVLEQMRQKKTMTAKRLVLIFVENEIIIDAIKDRLTGLAVQFCVLLGQEKSRIWLFKRIPEAVTIPLPNGLFRELKQPNVIQIILVFL